MKDLSNRIGWIDNCKGFAILLVVLGHIADGYINGGIFSENVSTLILIKNIVYTFHMPLFFMLSGITFYLAYCRDYENKIANYHKQLIHILTIYFSFSLLQWCTKMLFHSLVNKPYTFKDLVLLFIQPPAPYWYLYDLFFLYVFVHFIYTKIPIRYMVAVSSMISVLVALWGKDFLFPIRSILYFCGFFIIGIFIMHIPIDKIPHWIIYVVTGSIVMFAVIHIIKEGTQFGYWGDFGVALAFSLFIILLFKDMGELRLFNLMGKYCLEIYVLHCFITAANRTILFKLHITQFWCNVFVNMMMAVGIPMILGVIRRRVFYKSVTYR